VVVRRENELMKGSRTGNGLWMVIIDLFINSPIQQHCSISACNPHQLIELLMTVNGRKINGWLRSTWVSDEWTGNSDKATPTEKWLTNGHSHDIFNSRSTVKVINRLIFNRNSHYSAHNISLLDPILSKFNPVQSFWLRFFILFSVLPRLLHLTPSI
jgi:hypothetical protein